MARTKTLDRPLEDILQELLISGLDGGLLSDQDDMPINGCANCSNMLFGEAGSTRGRMGWYARVATAIASLDAVDGCAVFEDTNRDERLAVWAEGSLRIYTGLALTRTFLNSYAVGNRVCSVNPLGLIVYSDGVTIATAADGTKSGQRVCDVVADTDVVLEGSGLPLTQEPPACKVMCVYDSQVLIGNLKNTDGSLDPESVAWSGVGDPYTYLATNVRGVAIGDGGVINALVPFTMSTSSISPTNAVLVGKDRSAVFALRGATSAFEEVKINGTTGLMDGATVVPVPATQGAAIIYLGLNRHFFITNGVDSESIVDDRIWTELNDYIDAALAIDPHKRFFAGRDFLNNNYICNVGGGRWYAYNWVRRRWTKFNGWPDGPVMETINSLRQHQLYILGYVTDQVKINQMNANTTDNGASIAPFWESTILRGEVGENGVNAGSLDKEKLWYFCTLEYITDFGAIKVEFIPHQGEGDTYTHTIAAPGSQTAAKYDVAKYDVDVYAGATTRARRVATFRIPRQNSAGKKGICRSKDLKVRVSLDSSTPEAYFKLTNLSLALTERGTAFAKV